MSCRMVNVRVQVSRPAATTVSDRQTLKRGDTSIIGEFDGNLEETTEEEREALAGLDDAPSMRFVIYRNWQLQVRDRLKVIGVKWRHRPRFGHLNGVEYVVLTTTNAVRGMVAYLGPAQAEGH